jgi:2-octaprenyl-6-methoxyphenol hydroxylase
LAAASTILVVGGGHAGLLAAAAAAGLGFDVRLIDPQPWPAIVTAEPEGRSLAVLAGSTAIMQDLGVWPFVEGLGEPVWQTIVRDAVTGRQIAYDNAADRRPFAYGFQNVDLRRGLLQAFLAKAGDGAYLRGTVLALRPSGKQTQVVLDDGRHLEAGLVVAADGRASKLRGLAGIAVTGWRYDQSALALVIRHARPHAGAVREWLRPAGPLAFLPLTGQRTGVTWVERIGPAADLAAEAPASLIEQLQALTGGVLGRMEIAAGPALYPLAAHQAARYVRPRLALVGDAAHGTHPVHAQGFNMGVGDIGALARGLARARQRGLDPGGGEVLLPYERERRPANTRRLLLTDGLNRMFSTTAFPATRLRSLALATLDTVPPLKNLAMRHGMQLG